MGARPTPTPFRSIAQPARLGRDGRGPTPRPAVPGRSRCVACLVGGPWAAQGLCGQHVRPLRSLRLGLTHACAYEPSLQDRPVADDGAREDDSGARLALPAFGGKWRAWLAGRLGVYAPGRPAFR